MLANLLSASIISMAAGVGSLLFGFVSSVLIARMLGAHGTGLVAFAIWFGTIASTAAGMGLQNVLLRYMGAIEDPTRPGGGLARAIIGPFSLMITVASLAMLAWAGWQWFNGDQEMMAVWAATAVFHLIFAYSSLALSAARGMNDFASSARKVFYGCLMQVPFVIVGAYFFGAAGALFGQMVRHLPTALSMRTYIAGPPPSANVVTPAMRKFQWNTWLSGLFGMLIWTRIEFVFLGLNHQAVDIGYFAVGMTLAGLVVQLPEQMSAALMPYFGRHHDNNDLEQLARSYRRVFRWVALVILPICFGGAAIMHELLPFVFGEGFAPAIPSAAILVGSACITAMTIFPSAMISARERSGFILWATPLVALIMISLLTVAVPSYGAVGAAVVRAAVHTLWLGILAVYCWKWLSMPAPVVDLLKIIASALLSGGAAYAVLEYQGGLVGLVLAVMAGGFIYLVSLRLSAAIPDEDMAALDDNLQSTLPASVFALTMRVLRLIAAGPKSGGAAS